MFERSPSSVETDARTPDVVAAAIAGEIGREVDYRPKIVNVLRDRVARPET